jgi:hypothetical protein
MNRRVLFPATVVAVVSSFVIGACNAEKSSDPLSPTVAGPIPGVVITAPRIMEPPNGSKVGSDQQPLTITVANATTSGIRPLSYYIEIASDVEFKTVVYSKGGFSAATGSQTIFRLADALPSDTLYFWRVRAEDGANTGPFSAAAQLKLYTPVAFQAPAPIAPINNTTTSNLHPKFTWGNASRLGTPDQVFYTVELADTDTFTVSATATVPEQSGSQTGVDSPQDLPVSKTLFWHVRAFDSNNTGPWSATQIFKTPAQGSGTGGCSYPGHPSTWTTQQWHDCVFGLIDKRGVGPTVSISGILTLRPELNAMGADWQNGWRGDPRPRLFLPVPNCPPATSPNVPDCSYTRTVDMGDFGGPWLWIPR